MKLISTQTIGAGGSSTLTFSSIPQTYAELVLLVSSRTTDGAGAYQSATLSVNGVTTNQSERYFYSTGTGVPNSTTYTLFEAWAGGNGATANAFGVMRYSIPNYSSTTMNKVFSWEMVADNNGTSWIGASGHGLWSNTAAVTSLTLSANWGQYTTASLYGINPIPAASLGATPTVDYLVVAGGGGSNQGGGGAGGLLAGTAFAVSSGSAITVTVGAGGSAGAGNGITVGGNGGNSVFSTITATGGGGGGAGSNAGQNGGSGGGAGQVSSGTSTGGTGIAGQGYAGGTNGGFGTANYPGGGGGGAGAVGANAVNATTPGNGGVGVVSTINGYSTYYAGGGAGGLNTGSGTMATGGLGGGGNGNVAGGAAYPGAINTGGGAGGTGNGGAAGGSGVVIIRYPVTYNPPSATTGNPAVNYINGYRVYTWYNSGSITF